MTNAHEHLRPPGDQGGHDDRLTVVATLLHKLDDDGLKPLEGFLGTVDFIGSVLNPHGHRQGRLQSWLTHFALLLKYERDERVWLLQRHCHGVDYYPTDVPVDAPAGASEKIVASIAISSGTPTRAIAASSSGCLSHSAPTVTAYRSP